MPRRQHGRSSFPFALGAVVLVVLVVLVVIFRAPLSGMFWLAAAPVVELRNSLGATEATALRAELAAVTAALADRDAVYRENLDLKERLGRTDVPAPRILAGVLQRPPWTAYDTLLVDAGSSLGVAVGDLVSAGQSGLIGRVSEVYANQARVDLFSAPGVTYQALLNGTVPVAVEGQGGGSMQALVPAGTPVAVGDTVEFPGLAGGIAAKVSAVDAKMGESFIVIYMTLPANPAQLARVEILKQQ